jgi:hypothetical protein
MAMKDIPEDVLGPAPRKSVALSHLTQLFRRGKWRVRREGGREGPDLFLSRDDCRYALGLKFAVESRRDRLIPLLAAAILESQAFARVSSEFEPLAVVGAPRLPERIIRELFDYAERVAPGMAVGVVDLDGRIEMRGRGLEALRSNPFRPALRGSVPAYQASDLFCFSDLNQWMLKVLLADRIPAPLMSGPRIPILSVSDLARASRVSVPSASRLGRQLLAAGWVDNDRTMQLVRVDQLLRRWQAAAAHVQARREIGMRWLIPGQPGAQLRQALRRYGSANASARRAPEDLGFLRDRERPRACLALFSAAEALGVGHVHGAAQHIYLESLDAMVIDSLGLSVAKPGEPVHVFVRVPRAPQSVFRAAVDQDGVLVSDILQVWLDVSEHPARGEEQAQEIWRRVLRGVAEEGGAA